MKIPPQLAASASQIRENHRLQAGVALIAAILLWWLLQLLGDWRQARIAILQASAQQLEQTRSLATQKGWAERAEQAANLAKALQAEIPSAASSGMAQAEFQSWLNQISNAASGQVRLDVQAPVRLEHPDDVVRVTATLSGGLPPAQVMQLINRIESRQSLTTIPVATLRSDGLNQTFSLTVQGYYQLSTSPGVRQ